MVLVRLMAITDDHLVGYEKYHGSVDLDLGQYGPYDMGHV